MLPVILLITIGSFLNCKKESLGHERRILNVSIPEEFANDDVTVTSDSNRVYIEYSHTWTKNFIPFLVELYSNENITEVCSNVEFNGSKIVVSLEGLQPEFNSPLNTDQMITCFYVGEIKYEILVTYIFSEEEKISDN